MDSSSLFSYSYRTHTFLQAQINDHRPKKNNEENKITTGKTKEGEKRKNNKQRNTIFKTEEKKITFKLKKKLFISTIEFKNIFYSSVRHNMVRNCIV